MCVGLKFIVVFDRERKKLRYYRRPETETDSILNLTFEILVDSPFQHDLSKSKFLFQDDVNEGMFGSDGIVKLYKCQRRAASDFFYVHFS